MKLLLKSKEEEIKIGNLYSFHSNEFDFSKNLIDEKDITYALLNFPLKESIKVYPFFRKIFHKADILRKEIEHISDSNTKVIFEDSDYSEKVSIITFYLLDKGADIIFVSTVGLSYDSISSYEKIFKKICPELNKIVVVVYNESSGQCFKFGDGLKVKI